MTPQVFSYIFPLLTNYGRKSTYYVLEHFNVRKVGSRSC